MIVFRISHENYIRDINGTGAAISGGRWNSKGVFILYTAVSRSLAMLEVAVRLPLGVLPNQHFLATIELPDSEVIQSISENDLDEKWREHENETRAIGDNFCKSGKSLALIVPSVVVRGETNILINTNHIAFSSVKLLDVNPFEFDPRLFVK